MEKIKLYKGADELLHIGGLIVPSGSVLVDTTNNFVCIRMVSTGLNLIGPTEATSFVREDDSVYSNIDEIKTVLVDFFRKATSAEVANTEALATANLALVLSL